jgi:hypothetical protein
MTTATKYVVRSMTTTDFDIVRGIAPVPYHVYLMPCKQRAGAYWSSIYRAQTFATIAEAEAEIDRAFTNRDKWWRRPEIAPVNDRDVPTYWNNQKVGMRQVGTTTEIRA